MNRNVIYFVAKHVIEGLQREETSLKFSGRETDFARSLFDKQHDFNGTSLEKYDSAFIWVVTLNRNLHQVVYKKLEK